MALDLTSVSRLLMPLQRRLRLMVSRAVVALVDDAAKLQTVQVKLLAREVRDGVEHFQPFGFTARPVAGAEGIFLSVGSCRDHGVVVVVDDRRYRPAGVLEEGESAMYTATKGIRVRCRENGHVDLGTEPTDYVTLASLVKEELRALRDTVNALVSTFNGHGHSGTFNGTIGGAAASGTLTIGSSSSQASAPAAVGDVAATEVRAK